MRLFIMLEKDDRLFLGFGVARGLWSGLAGLFRCFELHPTERLLLYLCDQIIFLMSSRVYFFMSPSIQYLLIHIPSLYLRYPQVFLTLVSLCLFLGNASNPGCLCRSKPRGREAGRGLLHILPTLLRLPRGIFLSLCNLPLSGSDLQAVYLRKSKRYVICVCLFVCFINGRFELWSILSLWL